LGKNLWLPIHMSTANLLPRLKSQSRPGDNQVPKQTNPTMTRFLALLKLMENKLNCHMPQVEVNKGNTASSRCYNTETQAEPNPPKDGDTTWKKLHITSLSNLFIILSYHVPNNCLRIQSQPWWQLIMQVRAPSHKEERKRWGSHQRICTIEQVPASQQKQQKSQDFNSHLLPIKLLHVSVKLNSKEDKSPLLPAVDHTIPSLLNTFTQSSKKIRKIFHDQNLTLPLGRWG